jgi:predicted dehydrogenase
LSTRTMNRINLAVIGCGGMARHHMKEITESPHAELAGVMDVDREKAASAAEQFGTAAYDTFEAVIHDGRVQGVVLATPHHLHAPMTVQAAEAGKHVLVEKPMALNLSEARRMVAAADAAGIRLMVAQSKRFMPEILAAKRLIEEGRTGPIQHYLQQRTFFFETSANPWKNEPEKCGGLCLPIFGSHDVDRFLYLTGARPVRVHSLLRSFMKPTREERDGTLSIETSNGGIASLSFSMSSHIDRNNILLVGSRAALLVQDDHSLRINDEPVSLEPDRQFTLQVREFVEAVLDGREPVPSGRDALPTMAVLDAARESGTTGRVVDVPDWTLNARKTAP